MSDFVIKILGHSGTVLHQEGVHDSLIEAGSRATRRVWHTEGACGYEMFQEGRTVLRHFPFVNPLPLDPMQ